ncbi:hypothetical protein P0W64_07510 [Tsukamurella sp. 8F]|uniref:hypothetical protein n=1 Tax=unclassified Tsukamurella TaxID=2633480 RepID=UPI0023B943C3|nr:MULTISPECIES: hypothetical protein [unclassified Tsukamurella]MDF0528782.1 hypothetical protein [Tsukamurella sp. 8J]MDF0586617.1 hypothetical protein [Tsukamurella sp. 8F]
MTVLRATMSPSRDRTADGMLEVDVYDLPKAITAETTGVYLNGDIDQIFLFERRDLLSDFVFRGGRVLVNGHAQRSFLTRLPLWRRLDYRTPADLVITRVTDHPVWSGIATEALLFNTGRKGRLTHEERRRTGVAGFYGRGCYLHLPHEARVIHTIGTTAAPLDFEYPLGRGHVLVHGGNDLLQFADVDRDTERMRHQIVEWLEGA